MAETDNNNAPLEMRNTETAALKRIPASSNLASASSAARKTIKLKPLMPSSASASGSQSPSPAPASKGVVPPSILLNRKPAAAKTDEPPKFMSTNTAPISKMSAVPAPEKPIPVADLNDAPTKTVSIPRLQAKMAAKPAMPTPGFTATTTAAVPKATPVPAVPKPVPTTTAAVPRATAPAVPKPVPTTTAAVPRATITTAVPKVTPAPAVPKPVPTTTAAVPRATITTAVPRVTPAPAVPKPVPTTTAAVPRATITTAVPKVTPGDVTSKTPTVVLPAESAVSTTTQGIQKQAIDQAKMQSGLQSAKPAIKLRPSTSPAQSSEPLSSASPTIKLEPKADSTVSPMPPSPETSNPADVTVTTKIPRKTLQLKPKMPPGGATLREQGDIANQKITSGVEEGDQTIKQAGVEQEKKLELKKKAPSETPAAPPPVVEKKPKEKGKYVPREPNIIYSLCAILAFLVIGYTVFALTAQFLNIWQGSQISVPGFQQISGSSK